MKTFLLTTIVMIAFAANSLLNRAALLEGGVDPAGYSLIRVASGAAMLLALLALRERGLPRAARPDMRAVLGLAVYLLGFSFAYVRMDAGLGALILFGGVQLTMFGGALSEGERPPLRRWVGMGISAAGLGLLLWPGHGASADLTGFALMTAAAVGWGVYSLAGRRVGDPLAATGWNFVHAAPLVALAWAATHSGSGFEARGVVLAIVSGAVTSGLGYALWYRVLPRLGATVAGLSQLSVPAIATAMGVAFLDETLTLSMIAASALILGGIAAGIVRLR